MDVAEYKDLAFQIEGVRIAPIQQFPDYFGIAHRGTDDVLLGSVVEDQLERETPGLPALLLGPGGLVIRNLPDRDLLFGALFCLRHAFLPSALKILAALFAHPNPIETTHSSPGC